MVTRVDITSLIDSLRGDLARAADLGGEEARAAAERLLLALEPALRLTLMDALSQAATELGAAIPGVTVSVRLAGREPMFVVEGAPARPAAEESARITLRLPEALKTRAEALAARRGQSLNTWLVGAAARAAANDDDPDHSGRSRYGRSGRHLKGWAR
jgi:hypothetical protein